MDDEDERKIIRTLAASRIARLNAVVQRVHALASEMDLKFHAEMARTLYTRALQLRAEMFEMEYLNDWA